EPDRKPAVARQRLPVQRVSEQWLGFHRVLERDAAGELLFDLERLLAEHHVFLAPVGPEEDHFARAVADAGPLEHIAQADAREPTVRREALHRTRAVAGTFVAIDDLHRLHGLEIRDCELDRLVDEASELQSIRRRVDFWLVVMLDEEELIVRRDEA